MIKYMESNPAVFNQRDSSIHADLPTAFSDTEFKNRFRLSKEAFLFLCLP